MSNKTTDTKEKTADTKEKTAEEATVEIELADQAKTAKETADKEASEAKNSAAKSKAANLEIVVSPEHVRTKHYVILGRGDDKKFKDVEIRAESKSRVPGATTIEAILAEVGKSFDDKTKELTITFSPNTGDVIAVV